MTDPKMLSILEAARFLGIGRSTIYEVIKQGRLPVRKLGRRTLVRRDDLDRFIDALPHGTAQS